MRNSMKNEKVKGGRHQTLKARLLGKKKNERVMHVVEATPKVERELVTQESLVTKSVKTRIREVLELKHMPFIDNRISVIRATTEAITNQDYYSQEPINYALAKPQNYERSVAV